MSRLTPRSGEWLVPGLSKRRFACIFSTVLFSVSGKQSGESRRTLRHT